MLVRLFSGTVRGIEAIRVTIEVHITLGIRFFIVGLAGHAIRESQQRIESAIVTNGLEWPRYRVVINLAPADIRKGGTHFDLPLALGILAASGQVPDNLLNRYLVFGELSLDGSILPVRGVLPMVLMARDQGFHGVIIPEMNRAEATVVEGMVVVPCASLLDVIGFLKGENRPASDSDSGIEPNVQTDPSEEPDGSPDYSEVMGQEMVKRAFEVAAAGMHNLLLIGPPGSGKSMMAKRLPSIMPPLTSEEALQSTVIHSVAGRVDPGMGLIAGRPFRSPHHSSSNMALIGGGSVPRPGEISLAHNGILFLDELPEFQRHVLEVLRQPVEDREIHISRAGYRVTYPADFMLVAAMNPCPCGYFNHPDRECSCMPGMIHRYLSRISGPLLDRIDLHMEVAPVPFRQLSVSHPAEPSSAIRERVLMARSIQEHRFRDQPGVRSNAGMGPHLRRKHCVLDQAGRKIIRLATERLGLSVRAYDRILKVSRTIADLEASGKILPSHVAEAVNYRSLDRERWSG